MRRPGAAWLPVASKRTDARPLGPVVHSDSCVGDLMSANVAPGGGGGGNVAAGGAGGGQ